MRTLTRSIGLAVASAGCAATLALTMSAPTLAANKALMVNGIAAGQLTDIAMANILGGMFGGKTYERVNVPWPQQSRPITGPDSMSLTDSVAEGVVNLDAELTEALAELGPGEHVTLVGLSAGSLVVNDEVRKLANDPNAPDKSQLKIVVIADSSRILFNRNRYDAIIDYQYRVPAETQYDTLVVAAEYDGFADFPDRWWNFLAVANAFAGSIIQHVPTILTDLSTVPAENITVTTNSLGGVTTSYLIPAKRLPLVLLVPFLAPQEAELRDIIDSAYQRNDNKTGAAAVQVAATDPVVESMESAAVAEDAAVTEDTAPVGDTTPLREAIEVADTTPAEDAADTADTGDAEDKAPAEDATPVEDKALTDDKIAAEVESAVQDVTESDQAPTVAADDTTVATDDTTDDTSDDSTDTGDTAGTDRSSAPRRSTTTRNSHA